MKLVGFVALIAGIFGQRARRVCSEIYTRPEIRDLSPRQLATFINATRVLHAEQTSFITKQAGLHLEYSNEAHGAAIFLPWHREFIKRYERALQEVDPSIILPYWDWSRDSQSPERSPILSKRYFGGNGQGEEGCVGNGPFADWKLNVPSPHCLKRDYDSGDQISPFYSPEALETILEKSQTYHQFRERIEAAPHARVHASLGGSKGDMMTMYSPNDPIFYLHHTFIDLLWNEWQQRHPQLAHTYDGSSGASVSIKDNLPPFDVSVRSVLDTTSQCYKYPRYGADLPNTSTFKKLKRRQVNEGEESDMNNIVKAALDLSEPIADFSAVGSGTSLLEGLNLNFSALQPIAALDRTSRNKIRATRPIPEEYLNRNNIDVPTTRLIEFELNTLAAAYNALADFIPQAQLIDT